MSESDLLMEFEPETADVQLEIEMERPALEVGPPMAVAVLPITEILPADFQLPLLTKFVPNAALRKAADEAAAYALGLGIQGNEGLQRADLALTALRTSQKAILDHFQDPADIANQLHKRITTVRAEWLSTGEAALKTVGSRIYTEGKRLEAEAAEQRRKDQAEADRLAREAARKEMEAAEKAQAPAPVVQELKRQAETATAPPVAVSTPAAAPMRGSTTVTTWKARLVGTPGDVEQNPSMAELTPQQRTEVIKLFKAVIEGAAPMVLFELNWSLLNARAKAEKSALSIAGIESFEAGSVRAKGTRSR